MWLPELIKFCCWFPRQLHSLLISETEVWCEAAGWKSWLPSHVCPWLVWFASSQVPERVTIHFRISVVRPKGKTQKVYRIPPGAASTVPWAPSLGIVLGQSRVFQGTERRNICKDSLSNTNKSLRNTPMKPISNNLRMAPMDLAALMHLLWWHFSWDAHRAHHSGVGLGL